MKRKSIYILVTLLLPLLTAFSQSDAVAAADCRHCMPQHSLTACCGDDDRFAGKKGCAGQSLGLCTKNDILPVAAAPVSAVDAAANVRQRCLFKIDMGQSRHPSLAAILSPPEMHLPLLFILNCSFLI